MTGTIGAAARVVLQAFDYDKDVVLVNAELDSLIGPILKTKADQAGVVLTHTEVPDAISRRGIGSRLVRAALDDARAHQLRVVPRCPFVDAYIDRHPEYRALVTGDC